MTNNKWLNGKFSLIGLSPMDGVTDEAFRLTQCHIAKPNVIFTEFVSAEGLSRGGIRLFDHLLYLPEERPIIAQLFGKDPDSFYKAALVLCYLGFDGIDINMGCPARTVTQHGGGAALIDQPALASEIIRAVQSAVEDYSSSAITHLQLKNKSLEIINHNLKYSNFTPSKKLIVGTRFPRPIPTISVKTRLGVSQGVVSVWIPHLLRHNLDFITVHGRTLKQGYSGTADWDEISKVVNISKNSNTIIFGNGDIQNRHQGLDYCQRYRVGGVLIGRAAMGNPWAFSDFLPTWPQRFEAMKYHLKTFTKIFPDRSTESLRRHFLLYTSGHPRAKALRQKLSTLTTIDQLLSLEPEFTAC